MPPTPLSITVSPVKVDLPAGQLHATEHVTLTDNGTQPITVSAVPVTVHQAAHGCGVGGTTTWLRVTPQAVYLAPGQVKTVAVRISAPRTAHGTTDLTAVFTAHGQAASGSNVAVEGAVGSQFIVTATGRTHAPVCVHAQPHLAASTTGASGTGTAGTLALIAVLVVAVIGCLIGFRRELRKRRHGGPGRQAAQ